MAVIGHIKVCAEASFQPLQLAWEHIHFDGASADKHGAASMPVCDRLLGVERWMLALSYPPEFSPLTGRAQSTCATTTCIRKGNKDCPSESTRVKKPHSRIDVVLAAWKVVRKILLPDDCRRIVMRKPLCGPQLDHVHYFAERTHPKTSPASIEHYHTVTESRLGLER
ncbi:hypothetical protein CISG_09031 [Coccidioides immitis RMSCC 3703]|uniref:Uncharacterized protein n=1 Tax=Coccidioides immitis RMSCC 3703 TaxID=454286 RepID=A0A0J8RAJ5_COCIT|nr:hypothetical protein CISG_09031 [Coccidioides immitis RMSCC 3703]